MKVTLLGTGGADGIPAFYSDTRVSQHARANGGKNVRSRSAAIVDGVLKIDLGPDTWHQLVREGQDARDWIALLVTHSDDDHFSIDELQYAVYPFNVMEFFGFPIFGNQIVCRQIIERYPNWPFEVTETKQFQTLEIAEYRVTPVEANHKRDEDSHNYLIEDGRSVFLYATDTGYWFDRTWNYLQGITLDGLILECSEGFAPTPYNGHLDAQEFLAVIDRLKRMGTVTDRTQIVTTHHSHNGEATHDELEAFFSPYNIQVGYDGLTIEM
ncbi:MAG TPA: MBL fold metallo-hydrolase [Fimbriimonadaceae bacterium]|nr:MBL fold metallo-hydrolase [Fimbriimonadaceae bacterium]